MTSRFASGSQGGIQWVMRGTHQGDIPGIPATGKHLAYGLDQCFWSSGFFAGGCCLPVEQFRLLTDNSAALPFSITATLTWDGVAQAGVTFSTLGRSRGKTVRFEPTEPAVCHANAQELKQVAANTKRTEEGILVDLKSKLLFATDSAVLKPEAVEQVAKLGDILAKYTADRVRIQGYTDSTGSASHNEELSLRRAQAVREVLVSRGVKPEQMLVEGVGEAHPIADNRTAAGRSQNRRVELHIDIPQDNS